MADRWEVLRLWRADPSSATARLAGQSRCRDECGSGTRAGRGGPPFNAGSKWGPLARGLTAGGAAQGEDELDDALAEALGLELRAAFQVGREDDAAGIHPRRIAMFPVPEGAGEERRGVADRVDALPPAGHDSG